MRLGREEVWAFCREMMSIGAAFNCTALRTGCVARGIRQLPGPGTFGRAMLGQTSVALLGEPDAHGLDDVLARMEAHLSRNHGHRWKW